jgi:hypothetical protein
MPVDPNEEQENDEQEENGGTPPPVKGTKPQFTQEDVNRIVADRAARAKEAERKALLAEFGTDDVETVKKLIKLARDTEDASKTELEKKDTEIQRLTKERDDAAALARETRLSQFREKRDNIALKAAEDAGAVDAGAVVALLAYKGTLPEVAEDGKIDEIQLKKLVDDLKKTSPNLFATSKGFPSSRGKINPRSTKERDEEALQRLLNPRIRNSR